ncbi:MAG: acyltransferase [Bacteroidales bacterium]|nr:acyltransferase [Bacteroidales bacterium]
MPDEYSDIRPYDDHQFHDKIAELVREPRFEHAVRYIMPDVDYPEFVNGLLQVESQMDFQEKVMGPFLELLVARTTDGLTLSGEENLVTGTSYTFITNHRDIVLDASFLNLCFIRRHMPITQVAIGNNLLIYDWITDLVKLNRSFIVKRDVGVRQALDAARQLSGYIHQTIRDRHESVWIAQREGRAKDSNDRTQDALVKMLSLAGGEDATENLCEINILPVAISYEYDPNDYLKVREFLMRRRDPEFKKSQRDDLFSMETGLLGRKGRVHFHLGRCINSEIQQCEGSRAEIVRSACEIIDRNIHCGYRIFPCNYIAYDEVHNTDEYRAAYTDAEVEAFNKYVETQLSKVDVPDLTPEEREFMRHTMLSMYANPLKNQRTALDCKNI